MEALTVLDEVQSKWELERGMRIAKSGPSILHWKRSHEGQPPVREKAPSRADLVRAGKVVDTWEVYDDDNKIWKKVVTLESICREVLLAWSRRPDKSQRDPFATEFSKCHSGATKADVMKILRLLKNREYKEEQTMDSVNAEDTSIDGLRPLPTPLMTENQALSDVNGSRQSPSQLTEAIDKPWVPPPDEEAERKAWSRITGLLTPDSKASRTFSNSVVSDSPVSTPDATTSTSFGLDQAYSEPTEYPAQDQADRLFNDPRRHQLLAEYAENSKHFPTSHLSTFGHLAHYIFENGRPPRIWTCGGEGTKEVGLDPKKPSVHGKCKWSYDEADVLLLTEAEHAAWAKATNPPKLVIIRDAAFAKRRPAKTTQTWLRELSRIPKSRNVRLDIQRLERPVTEPAVDSLTIHEALEQWKKSQGARISDTLPPVNVLNISDNMPGNWPEGLTKEYQVLFDAISVCDSIIYRSLDQELSPHADETGLGKSTLMAFSPTDIQKCTQFRILAQRGAISSWHMDNVGVYTFVVLEGNTNDIIEKDDDVVKYWPVFPMHTLTTSEQNKARAEFGKYGINWRPRPKGKIPILALTRGDMLIQPPGTIHAPITLTDCFFLGGMCWRPSTIPLTIDTWNYLTKHPICTNEPLPRQTHMILDYLREVVHQSPADYGFDPNQPETLDVFDRMCDEICGTVVSCRCSKGCSLSRQCGCLAQGLRCGIYCHPGVGHDACQELASTVAAEAAAARLMSRSSTPRTNARKRVKRSEATTPSILPMGSNDGADDGDRLAKFIKSESQESTGAETNQNDAPGGVVNSEQTHYSSQDDLNDELELKEDEPSSGDGIIGQAAQKDEVNSSTVEVTSQTLEPSSVRPTNYGDVVMTT